MKFFSLILIGFILMTYSCGDQSSKEPISHEDKVEYLIDQIRHYISIEDIETAGMMLKELKALAPSTPEIDVFKSIIGSREESLLRANKFESLLEPDILLQYAKENLRNNNYDQALRFASAVYYLDPENERALQILTENEALPGNRKAGQRKEIILNGLKIVVRYIPSGITIIGSPRSEKERSDREKKHQVIITRGFWMMETEVTQELYEAVMGSNPSRFKGAMLPVERVSWHDAAEFCEELSRLTGRTWELPTEAEWEHACRAGTSTAFHYGEKLGSSMANFDGNSPYGGAETGENKGQTANVGNYSPNPWGLFDMHGNVYEWCYDWYGSYISDMLIDPRGPATGKYRVIRGGSWGISADLLRSAARSASAPDMLAPFIGFRAVLRD